MGFATGPPRAGRGGAGGEELLQLGVEGRGLLSDLSQGRKGRIEYAVEDHGPDVGRKEIGVGGSQQASVRETQVGELGVPEGGPQHVQVAGRIDGAHVGQLQPALMAWHPAAEGSGWP